MAASARPIRLQPAVEPQWKWPKSYLTRSYRSTISLDQQRAYPRETQEMVFDAHDRAFALFKGTCQRGIYDNMKTAVAAILVGKERLYNRRFLQM